MLLWFAGLALAATWVVFRDPAIDHRLIVVGAIAPDVVDAAASGVVEIAGGDRSGSVPWPAAGVAHSLAFAVALLGLVMVATTGRRALRRRLVALSIGVFLHLVLDAAWADRSLFWWPAFGLETYAVRLPSLARPLPLVIALEVAGAAALVWVWRTWGLDDAERRARFLGTGRLPRDIVDRPAHARRS